MNKKAKMREQILQHGFDLQRIYPDSNRFGPVELCKKLRRIERRASRMCEDMCSIPVDEERYERTFNNMEKRVMDILGAGPSVFINQDPRGYALKN